MSKGEVQVRIGIGHPFKIRLKQYYNNGAQPLEIGRILVGRPME